jgi:hypothetical protein
MLNLLKREKRYMIRAEYLGRLTNIFIFILVLACIYYGVLLMANGFLIRFEKKVIEDEVVNISLSSSQKDLQSYEEALKHLESEYNFFSKEIIFPTDFISLIDNKKISGVNLTAINFQKKNNENESRLEIIGVAQNRDILIKYANSFKTDPVFQNVNVPISSLAKNNEIPFSLSFNAKIEKQNEN